MAIDDLAVNPFVASQPWMRDAACAGMDVELFFPARGESTATIKATCAGCPVAAECLDYALRNGEKFGIWGGTSERERRRLRRGRGLTAPPKRGKVPQVLTDDQQAILAAVAEEVLTATDPIEATAWAVELLRAEGVTAAVTSLADALGMAPNTVSERVRRAMERAS